MFSRYDVLLDNKASLNIFSTKVLLTDVRQADQPIKASGIQSGGGVDGDFGEKEISENLERFSTAAMHRPTSYPSRHKLMQEQSSDMIIYKTVLRYSRKGA